jgi:hypothetical protein
VGEDSTAWRWSVLGIAAAGVMLWGFAREKARFRKADCIFGGRSGAGLFAACSASSGGDSVDFAAPVRATRGGIKGTGADSERDPELRASRHARQSPDTSLNFHAEA